MLPNLLQYPVALFGALRAGVDRGECQPAVHPARARTPTHGLGATTIIVLENFARTVQDVLARIPTPVTVITTQIGDLFPPAEDS